MRRLHLCHTTSDAYSQAVDFLPHTMLVRPREGHDVWIEASQLTITPAAAVQWHRDAYDNSVAVAHFHEQPLDFVVQNSAVNFPFLYDPADRMYDIILLEMKPAIARIGERQLRLGVDRSAAARTARVRGRGSG